jgi:hypothetical protein
MRLLWANSTVTDIVWEVTFPRYESWIISLLLTFRSIKLTFRERPGQGCASDIASVAELVHLSTSAVN